MINRLFLLKYRTVKIIDGTKNRKGRSWGGISRRWVFIQRNVVLIVATTSVIERRPLYPWLETDVCTLIRREPCVRAQCEHRASRTIVALNGLFSTRAQRLHWPVAT
jgi:hypothetical protein